MIFGVWFREGMFAIPKTRTKLQTGGIDELAIKFRQMLERLRPL
jgi:hypothetical protein